MNRTVTRHAPTHRLARLVGVAVLALPLAACGAGSQAAEGEDEPTTIRFALDWTPNTNHAGLYTALAEGYFEDAGLDVEVLPYNSSSPDTLVGAGQAEFGISFQSSATMSRSAGLPVTSVFAVLQHTATSIAVSAERTELRTPADLDGLTYAGFGGPDEEARMRQVIQNAGGTGEFESVVLGTSAYEAVYSGAADFTEPFIAWEGIEAEMHGEPLTFMRYEDYGFPDSYNVVVVGNDEWIEENQETAKAFVGALQQGYQLAADEPEKAAQHLIDENPGTFSEEELVHRSMAMLAEEYLLDDAGKVGTQTQEQWAGYGAFLFEADVLVDESGTPLTQEPDWSQFFTNDLLAD